MMWPLLRSFAMSGLCKNNSHELAQQFCNTLLSVAPSSYGIFISSAKGTAGVEFGRILEDIRKTFDSLSGGRLEETIILGTRYSLVFRTVDEENFLIVAVEPDGNLGKARYLIRRHLLAIRSEL